jgi:hypothetical protein
MLLLVLATLSSSWAITNDHSGYYASIGGGIGLGDAPIRPGPGWLGAAGIWWGQYDDAYAIGRFTSLGVTLRQDLPTTGLRTAPMLEVRRGWDLIVTQVHGFVAGGPVLAPTARQGTATGATARAGFGARYRFHRFWGLSLRLEGGADFIGGGVGATCAALLTLDRSRPFGPVE